MTVAPLVAEQRLLRLVYRRLHDDATLNTALGLGGRVWQNVAPPSPVYPHALLSVMSSVDLNTLTGVHVWQDVVVMVKLTDRGADPETILPLAERAAALLEGYTAAAEGVYVVRLRRTVSPPTPIELALGGERYVHHQQLWRTEVAPFGGGTP
jgi:hypothetical protein